MVTNNGRKFFFGKYKGKYIKDIIAKADTSDTKEDTDDDEKSDDSKDEKDEAPDDAEGDKAQKCTDK